MGKIIKLTESDLTRIVKRVIKEEQQQEKINLLKTQIQSKTDSCWSAAKYPLLWKIVEMTAASPFCLASVIPAILTQPDIAISHLKGDHDDDQGYFNSDGSATWKTFFELPSVVANMFCRQVLYDKLKKAIELGIAKDDKLLKEVKSFSKCVLGL